MIANEFLSDYQHGFVFGRSCTTQLLKVVDKLINEVVGYRRKRIHGVPWLDFAKAFDSVPHKRLLVKLAEYGITGDLLQGTRQFFIGRR